MFTESEKPVFRKLLPGAMAIFAIVFSAQASAFEELGKVEMAPAEKPAAHAVGVERHSLRNDEPYFYTVSSVEGGIYKGVDSMGCGFSGLDQTWGPSLSWKNCGGSTGSQTVTKKKGSPWPMKVKTRFSFNYTGISKGDTWKGYRKCKVKSSVRVRVPAGEFDTYKIVCSNKWETKTYWYAPEVEHSVAVKRAHKTKKSKNYFTEFVKDVTS